MRLTRLTLTLAALAALALPSLASAQANCQATITGPGTEPGSRPTCNVTRDVTTSIASVLRLSLVGSAPIQLIPAGTTDTVAYEMTRTAGFTATGVAAGGDASQLLSPGTTGRDSLIVQANRPYTLTMAATTDDFLFEQDPSYNVCRLTVAASVSCGSYSGANVAKPVTDLFWVEGTSSTYAPVPKASATAVTLHTKTTGERYATGVAFTSAWFYETDIPGSYTATVRYTLTGQ
jgi:hypothetical protein